MKTLLALLFVLCLALSVDALCVFGLRDRQVMVSPPEQAVEDFVKKLACRRFEAALPDLTEPLARRSGVDTLRQMGQKMQNTYGVVYDVRGEPGNLQGDRATARVRLVTSRRGVQYLAFPLTRHAGVWAISSFGELHR